MENIILIVLLIAFGLAGTADSFRSYDYNKSAKILDLTAVLIVIAAIIVFFCAVDYCNQEVMRSVGLYFFPTVLGCIFTFRVGEHIGTGIMERLEY